MTTHYPISLSSSSCLTDSQFCPGWRCAQLNIFTFPEFLVSSDSHVTLWPMRCKRKSLIELPGVRCDALKCSSHAVSIRTEAVQPGRWRRRMREPGILIKSLSSYLALGCLLHESNTPLSLWSTEGWVVWCLHSNTFLPIYFLCVWSFSMFSL